MNLLPLDVLTTHIGGVYSWIIATLAKFGIAEWLTLIGMIAGATLGAMNGLAWLWRKLKPPFTIKEIGQKDHEGVESFIYLYEKLIESRSRLDSDEIVKWIKGEISVPDLIHKTFSCTHSGDTVGFAQIIYCQSSNIGFISYFGVDESKQPIGHKAARQIAAKLTRYVSKKCKQAKYIVFEVDDPKETGIDAKEKSRRRARIRKFKDWGRLSGFKIGELNIDYIQPEMPSDQTESNECRMRLVVIMTDKVTNDVLAKSEVIEIVKFVYFRIYQNSYYSDSDELSQVYRQYLTDLLVDYEKRLPASIAVG